MTNKEIGCKNCANAPKTYEEFCLAKYSVDTSFCQDAFEERSKKCNLYDKSLDKEIKQ